MNKELKKQIKTRYLNGESINAIRKDLSLSHRTVSTFLKDSGIHVANIQTLTTFHKRRAKNMYDSWVAGQTLSEIGEFYDLNLKTVHGIIRDYCERSGIDRTQTLNTCKANRTLIKYHQNPTYRTYVSAQKAAARIGKTVKKVG